MNLGIICDVTDNKPVGVIATDHENGSVAYLTNNEILDKTIDLIVDEDDLLLVIPEKIDNKLAIRTEKINTFNQQYLMAFNYHLPYPWKVMALRYEEGNIEDIVKACYECMEVNNEKNIE